MGDRTRKDSGPTLSQTLVGVESPVRPTAPDAGTIDAPKLLKAWNQHTETLKRVLDAIEANEADNIETRESARHTRLVMYGCLAGMMIIGAVVYDKSDEAADRSASLELKATDALLELKKTQTAMRLVADAMIASNNAALVEHEETVKTPPEVASELSSRRRRSVRIETAPVPKAGPEVVKARARAQIASVKAQMALASDDQSAREAKEQMRSIEERAAALGVKEL